jgi:hypothetical protein
MKTIAYNPEREVITAILVLIISFSIITACRAQVFSTQSTGTGPKAALNSEKSMKTSDTENAAVENNLAIKIKSWMNSGTYWDKNDDVEEPTVSELAHTISKWMSDGSFWSSNSKKEIEADELASTDNQESACETLVTDNK